MGCPAHVEFTPKMGGHAARVVGTNKAPRQVGKAALQDSVSVYVPNVVNVYASCTLFRTCRSRSSSATRFSFEMRTAMECGTGDGDAMAPTSDAVALADSVGEGEWLLLA